MFHVHVSTVCVFVCLTCVCVVERQVVEGPMSLHSLSSSSSRVSVLPFVPNATDAPLPPPPPGSPGCHLTGSLAGWPAGWGGGRPAAAAAFRALCSSPLPLWSSSTPCDSPSGAA